MSWSKEELKMLVEGEIPWALAKRMMSSTKEPDRFDRILEILQEKVKFSERILLPIGEHLYIIEHGDGLRSVKCDCGYDFGDYRINWKLNASILVRDSDQGLEDLYPGYRKIERNWCELREFICPGCECLLEVEAVPPGYPIVFEFLPDLDGFYQKWLGRSLKQEYEFKDLSIDTIQKFKE
jgi:acetone carboxylase, gamma subunit